MFAIIVILLSSTVFFEPVRVFFQNNIKIVAFLVWSSQKNMGIIMQALHYNVGIITPMQLCSTTMKLLLSIAFHATFHSNNSNAMQCEIHSNANILHAMQSVQYNAYPLLWNALHYDNA